MLSVLLGPADRGLALRDLIATADYINHAVPTYDELAGSLKHLQQAGDVIKQADRYCAAPAIRSYYAQVTRPRRAIDKDWQDVDRWLHTTAVAKSSPYQRLTRTAYEQAVRAYLASV